MSTLPTRDRWLGAALPALIVFLAGWVWILRPAAKDVSLLERRVQNQGPLQSRHELVALARAGQAELEKSVGRLREVSPPLSSVFNHNLAMQTLSQLCESHHLSLDKTQLEPGDGKLPPALKSTALSLAKQPGGTPPQVWRLELSGSYSGVLKLLAGIQNAEALIVPLSISMQTAKNNRLPAAWTITLWL